jgi:hypothetical protein
LVGLEDRVETVEAILRSATDKGEAQRALLTLDRALERPVGTNQHGEGFDNILGHKAPTGTSEQAGLRRLRKAADKGDELRPKSGTVTDLAGLVDLLRCDTAALMP